MIISVTDNQRIAIYKGDTLIALLDEMGFPIITPRFFDLSNTELKLFWTFVDRFKVDY